MSENDNINPFADAPPEIQDLLTRLPPDMQASVLAKKVEFGRRAQDEGRVFSEKLTDIIDQEAPSIIKKGLSYSTKHPEDTGATTTVLAMALGEHYALKREVASLRKDLEILRKAHEAWVSDL